MDVAIRSTEAEWMDDPDVPAQDIVDCLADLARVNRVTLAYRPVLRFLDEALRDAPDHPLQVLDVGFGQGDTLRVVERAARRRNWRLRLTGIDLNPASAAAAAAATPADAAIEYLTGDVFAYRNTGDVDLVISSLFTHHLADPLLERFIDWMETTAERGWFVNDLYRSRVAQLGFGVLATALHWHPMVRHDGRVSIARSFRPADWRARLRGVPARIERLVPYRLCVTRLR